MTKLEKYYNKFNEDKRLLSRHGQVEFNTTMHYIRRYINKIKDVPPENISIIDIGAGTGRYSIELAKSGYRVMAVEPVKYNLGIIKKNAAGFDNLKALQRYARKLRDIPDEEYDITLTMGPLYHLHSIDDKVCALTEAKRVTKRGGYIFVSYVMADYAVVKYGFMDGNIKESIEAGALTDDYAVKENEGELYSYVRLNDIDVINKRACLKRDKILSPDGAADYIRPYLKKMDDEEFELFKAYQLKRAESHELLGAGSHILDILVKE